MSHDELAGSKAWPSLPSNWVQNNESEEHRRHLQQSSSMEYQQHSGAAASGMYTQKCSEVTNLFTLFTAGLFTYSTAIASECSQQKSPRVYLYLQGKQLLCMYMHAILYMLP